jgi:NADH dehydrogenase
MAFLHQKNGQPVPGVSPAAMQMGENAAKNILRDLAGKPREEFSYIDKGTMATIGKKKAIADLRGWHFSGFIAWLMWLLLHVTFLIGFRNRIYVLLEWFWAYVTRERSARLVTGDAEELRNALEFMIPEPAAKLYREFDEAKAKEAKALR